MAAVSQALVEFANHFRQPAAPGIEVIATPRYTVTLQPDYPIPGPNSIGWVRCRAAEADDVIREARAIVAPRRLVVNWILDPETEPADFADHLARHGVDFESEGAVMVLPIDSVIDNPVVEGLQMHDAMADPVAFRDADAVNSEAFESPPRDGGALERRRANELSVGNRRVLLATVDGEPAGSAGLTMFPPVAAIINGGAAARAIGCVRIKSCRRVGMADRDEPVIEIGRVGKIVSGDDAGDYILVQDQLTETGGYLILLGHDPALTSGGGDYWVERHQLGKAFKQKRWTVDWNFEGGGATVP
jgi:hypothetical protein